MKRNSPPPLVQFRPKSVAGGLATWQIKEVLDYIKANLGQSIAVADIAAVTGLSVSYFHRVFKRSFGLTVHLYLLRRRVDMAQRLMVSTSESLSEIAVSCGMSDQSHLTRLFKRVLGETPKIWRRVHRGAPFIVEVRPDVQLRSSTTPGPAP
jgi:AraC family transcriptional regulator